MTDQELKDLVASLAVANRETALQMKETDRKMQETDRQMKETDRIVKENALQIKENALQMKETALQMKETDRQMKETDRQMKETNRKWAESCEKWDKLSEKWDKINTQVDGINSNIGHHAEQFFQDVLSETLTFAGIKYDKKSLNVGCKNGKVPKGEFDIMLINGKNVAIIEVKNRIHPDFVKELAEKKAAKFRKFFPEYANCKLYLGVAGFSFCGAVVEEAKKYGVGIIRQVGKSIEVDSKYMKAY